MPTSAKGGPPQWSVMLTRRKGASHEDLVRVLVRVFGRDPVDADGEARKWTEGESMQMDPSKREIAEQKKIECAEIGNRSVSAAIRRAKSNA